MSGVKVTTTKLVALNVAVELVGLDRVQLYWSVYPWGSLLLDALFDICAPAVAPDDGVTANAADGD